MSKYSNIVYCDVSLEQYCIQNNLNYKYIINKLNSFQESKEKLLPLDLQIQLVIQKFKKRRRFADLNYKGLRLVDYCKNANIEYNKILG